MAKKYLKAWVDRTMVSSSQGAKTQLAEATGKSLPFIRRVLQGGDRTEEAYKVRRIAYENFNFGFITFE